MLKKLVSIFMAIACLMSFIIIEPNQFITEAVSYFSGSGTESDPYQISSANDLVKLSSLINNKDTNHDYRYAYYIQTSDIDLNGVSFEPIGGSGEPALFAGVYDGNFHFIDNLYVASSECFLGLFGRIGELNKDNSKSVIKNLCVEGNIKSTGETGLYVGGIAGEIAYGANIVNCCFIGTAIDGRYVGGIAGRSWCGGSVVSCYSNSVLSSTVDNAHIGGIIGDVTIGENSTVGSSDFIMNNCYFSGDTASKNEQLLGGIIGCIYYSKVNTSVKLELLNNLHLITSCDDSIGTNNADGCQKLSYNELKDCAEKLGDPYITNTVSSYNDGYPIFDWQLADAEGSKPINIPFIGNGTKEDPYQISNAEELTLLSEISNDKDNMEYFSRCHYIQTDDIDLNNKLFTPIAIKCDFEGTYNGNYHKITNLKISTSKNDSGLFSIIAEGGYVSNLSVYGTVNSSGNNIGGIAGKLGNEATIINCDYHGTVKGSSNIGALAGLIENDVTIESCYSDAQITGNSSTGGLIGSIQSATNKANISKLYFSGTVNCSNNEQGAICGTINNANPEINTIYFLSDICNGNSVDNDIFTGCTKLSESALKACADMLGSPFTTNFSGKGFPVFEWQSKPYQFDGNGTKENPYQIATKTDLYYMQTLINSNYYNKLYGDAYFVQTADIDLENESWIPIATSESRQSFRGEYNGSCHYINGLNIDTDFECAGLFGVIDGAEIFDIVVYGSVTSTANSTGGIVGQARNKSTLKRCAFIGDISSANFTGGIVGILINSNDVIDCYHNGLVKSDKFAGGIVGNISSENEKNNCSVTIQNCYQANGVVYGNKYSGCIAGNCELNASSNIVNILNSFSTTESDAIANLTNVTKDNTLIITKSQLKKSSEDLGRSFIDNTVTDLNNGYPVFTWQIKSDILGDVNNDGVFDIADAVMMQKWLLGSGQMINWENGDLCKDNRIDIFDFCMMRHKLIYG